VERKSKGKTIVFFFRYMGGGETRVFFSAYRIKRGEKGREGRVELFGLIWGEKGKMGHRLLVSRRDKRRGRRKQGSFFASRQEKEKRDASAEKKEKRKDAYHFPIVPQRERRLLRDVGIGRERGEESGMANRDGHEPKRSRCKFWTKKKGKREGKMNWQSIIR